MKFYKLGLLFLIHYLGVSGAKDPIEEICIAKKIEWQIDSCMPNNFNAFVYHLYSCKIDIRQNNMLGIKGNIISFKNSVLVPIDRIIYEDSLNAKLAFDSIQKEASFYRNLPLRDYSRKCWSDNGSGCIYVARKTNEVFLIGTSAKFFYPSASSSINDDTANLKEPAMVYKFLSGFK
jgi:hypothetical protein